MSELLPCPFCGECPDKRSGVIKCKTPLCPASLGWAPVDSWNRRHAPEGWQCVPVGWLKNLRSSIVGDCYMGEEWEIATIEAMLTAAPKPGSN